MTRLIFMGALLCLSACSALYSPTNTSPADGGTDVVEADGGPLEGAVTPVSCPVRIERACDAEQVACSWDSTLLEHASSLSSNVFQVKGVNGDKTKGGEVAATFVAPQTGTPLLVGFSVRNIFGGAPYKLRVDIVPMNLEGTAPLIPTQGEVPLGSALYLISNSRPDMDTPVTLTFDQFKPATLVKGRTYALYFHVDSKNPAAIGLVGHNASTIEGQTVYQRSFTEDSDGSRTYAKWAAQDQKSLNFFVTVGGVTGSCSNPTGLSAIEEFPAPCWTRVPGLCPCVNSVRGICSVDPNAEPRQPIWPGLFQLVTSDLSGAPPTQTSAHVATTFSGVGGIPLSAQLIVRRTSLVMADEEHSLVAEIVPVEETGEQTDALHWTGAPVATARFDTSRIPLDESGHQDRRISLNFKAVPGAFMDPKQTYALYLHLSPGSLDRFGLAGTEADARPGFNVYTRQIVTGASGLEEPWAQAAGRKVDFALTVADACSEE